MNKSEVKVVHIFITIYHKRSVHDETNEDGKISSSKLFLLIVTDFFFGLVVEKADLIAHLSELPLQLIFFDESALQSQQNGVLRLLNLK
jgi:hypothetical protein